MWGVEYVQVPVKECSLTEDYNKDSDGTSNESSDISDNNNDKQSPIEMQPSENMQFRKSSVEEFNTGKSSLSKHVPK